MSKMTKLDSFDERLIVLLAKDARQSSKKLAKTLKTSPATVRRRIQRLLKEDIIAIIATADPEKMGLGLVAVLTLNIEPKNLEAGVEYLASKDEVVWLAVTTGRFDVMTVLRFVSTDELYAFLRAELPKIEGLKNSETFVCLRVRKAPYVHSKLKQSKS